MKRNERIAFEVRRYKRGLEVEKIQVAPLVDNTVAGFPWRAAWIIIQTMLFIDDRHDEMEGPQEWMQRKLRN